MHLVIHNGSFYGLYPPFDADTTVLPVEQADIVQIMEQAGVPPGKLLYLAVRAESVLKFMRHVADFGITIDLESRETPWSVLRYLDKCTLTAADVAWWINNTFLVQAPDWVDSHGVARHLRTLQSDTQLHEWIRAA